MTKNYLEILPGLSVFFLLISKTIPFPNCNFYLDSLNIDAKFKKKNQLKFIMKLHFVI